MQQPNRVLINTVGSQHNMKSCLVLLLVSLRWVGNGKALDAQVVTHLMTDCDAHCTDGDYIVELREGGRI